MPANDDEPRCGCMLSGITREMEEREVNGGVNRVLDFSTIIAQQLQNLLPTIVAQVGDQGRGQGNGRNQNDDTVNDNIRGDVSRGCIYKEFLPYNPKEYDGKRGAIVYTRWIEKIESVQDMSGCRDSQKVKYTAGLFVGKALTWWNSQIHTQGREAAIGMSWEDFKTLTREEFCPSNEMQKFHELASLVPYLVTLEGKRIERNGSIKKNPEKRGNEGEPSKDRNGRANNKRTRTGNAFATTTNPINRENTGAVPKCTTYNTYHPPEAPWSWKPKESGKSFVSTTFIPLLDIEPSELGFSYEIEIASGQLVEIDKVIKGCKLEIEGHVFDINLIPFGSGSFDVIIGIDWLFDHKAEIICHEKVVRIPLLDGQVLRVPGEKPEEKMRQLISAKAKEKKHEEIVVVRDFPEVFLDDLSGLPPVREIKFRIELVPGAMLVAKSPYPLTPS
ncbi:putative reverse transcriptase domain-containing protein [Tanacetum coccineum]